MGQRGKEHNLRSRSSFRWSFSIVRSTKIPLPPMTRFSLGSYGRIAPSNILNCCSSYNRKSKKQAYSQMVLEKFVPEGEAKLSTTSNATWKDREAVVLALGAIAEGCINGLYPHLPLKNVQVEGRNRRALGDMENLLPVPTVDKKPQTLICNPITRNHVLSCIDSSALYM